jgi:hypothetical protein
VSWFRSAISTGTVSWKRFIAARRAPPEIGQVTFVAARRSIGYPGWRLQHRAELIDRLRRQWARCGRLRRSRTQP